MDLSKLTDKEISKLELLLSNERGKRHEQKMKNKDECPICHGTGDVGTEQDHWPCGRCKTTGKYFPLK